VTSGTADRFFSRIDAPPLVNGVPSMSIRRSSTGTLERPSAGSESAPTSTWLRMASGRPISRARQFA
jgi:hypothetical protein